MNRIAKILALTLALVLVVGCFAACGAKTTTVGEPAANNDTAAPATEAPATEAAKGATETWGNVTILVPDGFTLSGGSLFDDQDPDELTINGNGLEYFQVHVLEDEDSAKDNLDTTKSFNEESKPEDVTVTVNGTVWTGVYYNSFGYDCFQLYADLGGKFVQVNGCGFKQDSAETTAVLGSIVVK